MAEFNFEEMPPPRMATIRRMLPGEVRIFREPDKADGQKLATSHIAKVGGKFSTKRVILLDPSSCTAIRAVMVLCIEQPGVNLPQGEE